LFKDMPCGQPENLFKRHPVPPPLISLFILKLLLKKPMHGYQISEELSKIFGCKVPRQVIYFILKKHEKAKHVVSTWIIKENSRPKKKYSITELGKKFLEHKIRELKKIIELLDEI